MSIDRPAFKLSGENKSNKTNNYNGMTSHFAKHFRISEQYKMKPATSEEMKEGSTTIN